MAEPSPTLSVVIREEERRHFARLLEKRMGRSLSALVEQANAYRAAQPVQARRALEALARMASRALTDLYALVSDMGSGDLDDLGLGAALEALASRVGQQYGLTVALDLTEEAVAVPAEQSLAAYRIVQEALHNAGQHAGAGRVGVSFFLDRRGLRLTVADDGSGFQPPAPLDALAAEGRRGLAEMVERAKAIGGEIEVSSVRGVGTQVRADLPFVPSARGPEAGLGADDRRQPLAEPLTPREREVLAGVAQGLTNKQIGSRLGISDRTVQFHLGNVLGKLGVASRTEAAVLALEQGLV
jgi:signal transduction histidine kinase/DNA-binding CsgD family transcriptional regulator